MFNGTVGTVVEDVVPVVPEATVGLEEDGTAAVVALGLLAEVVVPVDGTTGVLEDGVTGDAPTIGTPALGITGVVGLDA